MLIFTTKNSKYRVMFLHNTFHVTKIEVLNPDSTFTAVGQTFVSKRMRIEVGDRANFDGLSTSEVVSIADSAPLPKDAV